MSTVINVISDHRQRIETGRDLDRRQRTIGFCYSVLNGQNKQICDVIEEHNFSPLDIGGLKLTKETFDISFKHVCKELFRIRPVRISYIIPIFAYAMKLNEFHLLHCKDWYESDLLVCSLTDVLIENGIEVTIRSKCTLL